MGLGTHINLGQQIRNPPPFGTNWKGRAGGGGAPRVHG